MLDPRRLTLLLAGLLLAACGPDTVLVEEEEPTPDGDLWSYGDAEEPPEPGKADAVLGSRALPRSADTSTTAVWTVTRNWSDKVNVNFSPYFKASEGITWNEAYRRFAEKMEAMTGAGGYKTYRLANPWGKTLPIPALECAEQAMFLRVTFSAWFGLPFFIEARDASGRVFAGHFGFRTLAGRYRNFPEFKTAYRDYTATATAANWPQDAKLRARRLGGDDRQDMIAPGAPFGAYLDELHANKRVGHFTALMLVWFGSVNLADPANTFHLKPEAIRAGDVLLERWQRAGIGHALIVKTAQPAAGGKLAVEVASGSMPRRQALWESQVTSRRYFLAEYAGGPGNSMDGTPYAKLGGGLRRWRVAAVYNGGWVNLVPSDSTAAWINSTDLPAIAARTARFDEILEVPDPAVRRQALVAALDAARQYQRQHPASCSNREKREALLDDLAQLEYEENWWSREQTERKYRAFDDYVYPLLAYERSKTCCWNTTTAAMGDIVRGYNKARQQTSQQCLLPVTFTAENYATFKQYAASVGRAAEWREWSEDEPCPQRTVTADTVSPTQRMAPFCDLRRGLVP